MLLIACAWCGPRDEVEFRYGGQAHVAWPTAEDVISDAEWGAFLFIRDNPQGDFAERWVHQHGCRRWFNVVRSTVTHEISAVYPAGQSRPESAPGRSGAGSGEGAR